MSVQAAGRRIWWRGLSVCAAAIVFGTIFLLLHQRAGDKACLTLALTGAAIVLWVAETIPIGQTSFLVLLIIGFTGIVPLDTALSGFASSAIFLIIAGMMMARAVNDTSLIQRLTYYILLKIGSTTSRILAGIILISQIQAFFYSGNGSTYQFAVAGNYKSYENV